MKTRQSGPRRLRITLQNPASPETFDTFAQPVETYVDLTTVWARFWPIYGQELVNAKQIKGQATIEIEFRWLGNDIKVTPETRAVGVGPASIAGRVFGFTEVRNIEERQRYYLCKAYEIQTVGPA